MTERRDKDMIRAMPVQEVSWGSLGSSWQIQTQVVNTPRRGPEYY